MRRLVLITACMVGCGSAAFAGETIEFDRFFTGAVLRVDIVHGGTITAERISIRRLTMEARWPGPRDRVAPPWDRGTYRLDVTDTRSGRLIFRRGFDSLFGEWRLSDIARLDDRDFEETLEVPFPRDSIDLSIYSRNMEGKMELIFEAPIDPASPRLATPDAVAVVPGTETLLLEVNGAAEDKVDLLVLGDGYTEKERLKFEADCGRLMDNLFTAAPFDRMRSRFNVRAVFVPSNDSGIDEPRKGVFKDTPFGMSFSTFDLARYCMTESVWAVHNAAAQVPHDVILLMANSSRYGGGGIYNHYTAFVSDNEYDDYLTLHEFGHGFAGLADEYYSTAVAHNAFYPEGVEPTEPNITALLDPYNLKWAAFAADDTPIPTPAEDPRFDGEVGAFEGAGYAAKGLYRPAKDCRMFSKGNQPFCRVCEQALADMILWYAPDAGPGR